MVVGVLRSGLPPPYGGHDIQWEWVVAQPLPGVPVAVLVTQPLPGVRGFRRHRHRRLVRLQLPGRRGPSVSKDLPVVGVQVVSPPLLFPVPRELRVRWASGGCRGSSRSHGRRCGICERSGVVG